MSEYPALRASPGGDPEARYLAWLPASTAGPAQVCKGETVDEVRERLERVEAPGRYRLFDRRPATRGIDAELVGVFVVSDAGVQWKPLRHLSG